MATHTRIIPARAGFTVGSHCAPESSEDHPRSRGVYSRLDNFLWWCNGSSPLARGLPLAKAAAMARRRIIPARAGFTSPTCTRPPRSTDHPRSRGVYLDEAQAVHSAFGSSPLARGLRDTRPVELELDRIIPARAGFTSPGCKRPPESNGSSPLARGLLHAIPNGLNAVRIIPARAGFTVSALCIWCRRGDHPRSRGVYT